MKSRTGSWRMAFLGAVTAAGLVVGRLPAPVLSPPPGIPTPEGEAIQPDWIEVQPGDLPIILSAPHGGELTPADLPDRQDAVVLDDPNSLQFTLDLADALESLTGRRPTVVINHLNRIKLDPNRSLALGAQGSPAAQAAWQAYHDAITRAEAQVTRACGWGQYVDVHSNGEPAPSVQLGYGLTVEDLDHDDQTLSTRQYVFRSNWRSLADWSSTGLADLVRGPDSLGGRLAARGYRVFPSPEHPVPEPGYFDGGYSVAVHGSQRSGAIDSTQIEVPYSLLELPRRATLAHWLASALVGFMDQSYGFDLMGPGASPCSGFADVSLGDPAGPSIARLAAAQGLPACGQDPRRLCAQESLTRAEAAQAAWRLLASEHNFAAGAAAQSFTDLPADPSQVAAISGLQAMGVLQPCAVQPLRYCPQQVETRAEAAFLGMKLLEGGQSLPPVPSGLFADAAAGQWSTWWIEAAVNAGLLKPCSQDGREVCPQASISRQDFAWLLDHALPASPP
jgi:hypothetical protein